VLYNRSSQAVFDVAFGQFDLLLKGESVPIATTFVCLGQSAASSALGRLREHFNDPLLVQVGRRLEPTALGLELLPKVRAALALTREIVDAPLSFDPANCDRHITLVASDYVADVLLPAVNRSLQTLEAAGRITSQLDPKDARRYTVRLTASGKELHDRVLKVALERESRLLSGLTPAEVDTLVDLLGRLHMQVPNVNSYDPSEE
jgi:hypothetical protein